MDKGTLVGAVTIVVMLLFALTTAWALSRRREAAYRRAAELPLEDEPR